MKSPDASPRAANDHLFHAALEEQPLWSALYESLSDALFPRRLPPLELTSKPVPVVDRMAVKTNPWALGTSTIVNGLIAALAILLGMQAAIDRSPKTPAGPHIDLGDIPLFALHRAQNSSSGGSGGSNDLINPNQGRNPSFNRTPLTPPMVPVIQQPRLAVESSVNIRLPDDSTMPNIGVHNSPNVSLPSNGPGLRFGIGTNGQGAIGSDPGPGYGPGTDPGMVYSPGRGVVAPALIFAPEAEFSDEARRSRYQGICLVSLIVDAHGNPQNPRVVQRLGMGLDEKALEAIQKYKFKPGTKDGKPVPVRVTIEVDFRMF
jgi:TonB family protein